MQNCRRKKKINENNEVTALDRRQMKLKNNLKEFEVLIPKKLN